MHEIVDLDQFMSSVHSKTVFPIYLVNAESKESCSICSETGFISEQLCMKTFVVLVDAEE